MDKIMRIKVECTFKVFYSWYVWDVGVRVMPEKHKQTNHLSNSALWRHPVAVGGSDFNFKILDKN